MNGNESENKKTNNMTSCGCGGKSCCSGSGRWIWIILIVVIAGTLIVIKNVTKKSKVEEKELSYPQQAVSATATSGNETEQKMPKLIDLGADKCVPCVMMAPILEELKKEYAGIFNVQFIDVWKNPSAARQYGIRVIPTQIFLNAEGKELFRHEGFFSKEDILQTWKRYGINVDEKNK